MLFFILEQKARKRQTKEGICLLWVCSLPNVTKTAQSMAAWVECPDRFMVRYEMGMSPTPHATANMRIPI